MPDPRSPLSPEVRAELDRQYRAMEESLLKQQEQQRALAGGQRLTPQEGGAAAGSRGGQPNIWAVITVGVVLAVLLGMVVVWQGFQLRKLKEQVAALHPEKVHPSPPPTSLPPPPPLPKAETAEEAASRLLDFDGSWTRALTRLAEQPERLLPCVSGIAETQDLDDSQVSNTQKKVFGDLAHFLQADSKLSGAEIERIRKGCFEYAVACWLRRQEPPNTDMVVNLVRSDIPEPLLPALLKDLAITTWGNQLPGVEDPELQAAVTVTFLLQAEAAATQEEQQK